MGQPTIAGLRRLEREVNERMRIVAHIERTRRVAELPELFARARQAGFDGVELVIGDGCTCELSSSEKDCRALARQAEQFGTGVRSVLLADDPAVRLAVANPEERARNVETVRGVVQHCRWLGAGVLRLVPAALGAESQGMEASYQEALNHTYDSLEMLRVDFERGGVVAGMMPCHHRFLLSPPEFRELLDRLNSPWIGAALDWTACAEFGAPADWVSTLQHRLAAVRWDDPAARLEPAGAATVRDALRDLRADGILIRGDKPDKELD